MREATTKAKPWQNETVKIKYTGKQNINQLTIYLHKYRIEKNTTFSNNSKS